MISSSLRKKPSAYRRDVILSMTVLAFVGLYLGWHLYDSYNETLEREYVLLEVNAEHTAARISDNLRGMDFMLQGIASERLGLSDRDMSGLARGLAEKAGTSPAVERIGTIDLHGRVEASSDRAFEGTRVSGQDYFTAFIGHRRKAAPHIGNPYTDKSGKTVFSISRPIRDARRRMVGVAFATVSSRLFAETLRSSQLITDGSSLLTNTRGDVLYTGDNGAACRSDKLLGGAPLSAHRGSNDMETRHLSDDDASGARCLSVFLTVPATPLIVATFRDYDDAIAPWRRESLATFARFALVVLFIMHFVRKGREKILGAQRLSEQMLESASVVVLGLNHKGEILLFNKMGEQITGYKRDELIGQDWFSLMTPRDRYPAVWEKFTEYQRHGGDPQSLFEAPLLTKDGEERIISWQSSSMTDHDPELSIIAFGTDITDQRGAEALFRAIAEHSNDATIIFDQNQIVRYVSPAMENITGYPLDTLTDGTSFSPVLPANEEPARSALRHILRNPEESIVFEQTIRHRDGHPLTLEISMSNLLDTAGIHGVLAVGRDITTRKQAEHSLALSELNLRKAQEITRVGSWNVDFATQNFDSSEELYRIYGFPGDTRTFEEMLDRIHPEDRAKIEKIWREALAGKAYSNVIHRIVIDGAIKWVNSSADIECDSMGTPVRGIGTVQDITERMEIELALLAARENLRRLIDESPLPMLILEGQDQRIVLSNRKFHQLTGYSVDDIPTLDHWMLFAYPDPAALRTAKSNWREWREMRARRNALLSPFETTVACRDGASRIIELREVTIDHQTLLIMIDLTERRRAEARLSETLNFNARIIEESPAGIVVFAADGHCVLVNEAAVEISGATREQLLEQNFRKLKAWRDNGMLEAALVALDNNRVIQREAHYINSFGKDVWLSYEFAPITLENRPHLLEVFTDISEYRLAEQAQREAARAADSANRSKSEFLANMSHEIRTPMNALIGLSQLALDEATEPRLRDYLQKIYESSGLLLHILNDILDYSKIEAGYLKIENEVFTLHDLMENTFQLFRAECQGKGLEFTLHLAADLPARVIGDWLRLGQVLNNLVSNAIKFTERGRVDIRLHRSGGTEAKPRLAFEVADSGIGMTADQVEQLFQPFMQADGSITRRFGGTGLGLAISHRLLQLMSGEITVQSTYGAGTTFRFELELEAEPTHPDGRTLPSPAAKDDARAALPSIAGTHVLIVEDNRFNQTVLADFLHKAGVVTIIANHGAEALDILAREMVDAVLMDLQMPEMDGFETVRRIRAERRWADLPIIAVTASVMVRDRERCMAAGMNDHLAKPVDFASLIAMLAQWVPTRGHQPTAAEPQDDNYDAVPESLPGHLEKLLEMIDGSEFIPDDFLRGISALLPKRGVMEFRALEQALSRYDFARSRKALLALAAALDIILQEKQ